MAGIKQRRQLGDLLLLCSALILEGTALFGVRTALAARQLEGKLYLTWETRLELPLPLLDGLPTPTLEGSGQAVANRPSIPEEPTRAPTELIDWEVTPGQAELAATQTPSLSPPASAAIEPTLTPTNSPEPQPTQAPPPASFPSPTPARSTGRIVRLLIPRLGVDRAVVPLGLIRTGQGSTDWNTDKLFATANRKDLIGQTVTSVNPGEGGNIVLMGHNYDNGYYAWEGVFLNIKTLSPGDAIIAYTEGGGEYHYSVKLVKKVPWRQENAAEAEKHFKYLGPTPEEQLTLVTCGGANMWLWQARLYVVAAPAQ